MQNVNFRARNPYVFAFFVAGGTLGAVALSMVIIPHQGLAIAERLTLALVVVVSVAARLWGSRVGVIAAVLSVGVLLAVDLGVYGRPTPTEELDLIVDLGIFLAVALVQGIQTGELRDTEVKLLRQEHETALLVRLSAQLVPDSPMAGMLDGLGGDLNEVLGASRVTVFVADEQGDLKPVRAEVMLEVEEDPRILQMAQWAFSNLTAIMPSDALLEGGAVLGGTKWVAHSAVVPGADRQDVFMPMISMSGPEGVLRVVLLNREQLIGRRDQATVEFIAHLFASFRERQRLRDRVSQAEAIEEADRVKSAIMSSVSHELKTPLAAATTTVTSLLDTNGREGELGDEAREELLSVGQDLETLQESIDSLLEISRLEASQWKPNMEWNDVNDLCATARAAVHEDARSRISMSLPGDLPLLCFDFGQMARALHHLIENALLYAGPQGHVELGAARSDEGGVRLWVQDDGPGVPDDEKECVFEKFTRGRSSECHTGGSGLGLAIVADIASIHGARVWVEDADPRGARFVIELRPEVPHGRGHV